MVQVFMVLRCFSCQTFQVHQVKKTNRWNCKVCNEKQSVVKTYGKGSGADCRRHVQKLNMLRGERDKMENEQIQSSHPPDDYADTFTTRDKQLDEIPQHPVLLAGKSAGKSKWTSFIEPEDDEDGDECDGVYTTDRGEFSRAQKPPRKQVKRSISDRGSRPVSIHTSLPSSTMNGSKERVYPYSCLSQEMEDKLDDHSDKLSSSKSTYHDIPPSDRYRKLEDDSFVYSTANLLSGSPPYAMSSSGVTTGTSPSSPSNHKDSMARIREDISRYKCGNPPESKGSTAKTRRETVIPKVSSKWTQFMCEEDSEEDDDDQLLRKLGSGLVTSGSAVAHYSAPIATKQYN